MNTKDAKKLQRELCARLVPYYEPKGYQLDKKEWSFINNNIEVPFYISSSKGPFITMRPSIVNSCQSLLLSINEIISEPILENGIFYAGEHLCSSLDIDEHQFPFHDKIMNISGSFFWNIYNMRDVDNMMGWHIAFMEKVGWELIKKLNDEDEMFSYYKDVFIRSLNGHPNSALSFGAQTTMIYLAYKNKKEEADELLNITVTIPYFKDSLYSQRALEIRHHFVG